MVSTWACTCLLQLYCEIDIWCKRLVFEEFEDDVRGKKVNIQTAKKKRKRKKNSFLKKEISLERGRKNHVLKEL